MRTPGLTKSGARRGDAALRRHDAGALRQRGETAAGGLPPLLIAAERVAATVAQGVHGRRRVGQGETFWQFRRYNPGDAPQMIDWRASAKTRYVYVRETEWEAAQSLWAWCDSSPSMRYTSRRDLPEKAEVAAVLALALSSLLVRAGEQVALLGEGMRPSSGRATLNRMAAAMAMMGEGASVLPVEPLPRNARIAVFSDFLSPVEEIRQAVTAYTARGVRGHLVQIVDPAEESLPFHGRVRFGGLEGEADYLVSRVDSVRGDYQALIAARRAALADAASGAGWSFTVHRTDMPPQTALMALYTTLSTGLGWGA